MRTFHGVTKVVSGGQTGVDRGALEAAIELGIEHGGWCPRGRLAEDGVIDAKYALTEMPTADYAARTEQNVIDSDGTLILYRNRLQGGTLLTHRLAKRHQKPLMRARLDREVKYDEIIRWLTEHEIRVLNVAGPRGSSGSDLADQVRQVMKKLFESSPALPYDDVETQPEP